MPLISGVKGWLHPIHHRSEVYAGPSGTDGAKMGQTMRQSMPSNAHYAFTQAGGGQASGGAIIGLFPKAHFILLHNRRVDST